MTFTAADIEAFKLAIELKRERGGREWEPVEGMLSKHGFEYAGRFASYSLQCDNLKVKPWQPVPATEEVSLNVDELLEAGDDGVMGRYAVQRQSWRESPTSREPRRNLRPTIAARSWWARLEAIQRKQEFTDAYRAARRALLAGVPILFPPGTYWLRRFMGVSVESFHLN